MKREKCSRDVLLDPMQEARMERRKVATKLFMFYEELIKAGFNADQALFVLNMIARMD